MARRRDRLLRFFALAAIAVASSMPAYAEDAVPAPTKVQDEQVATPVQAAASTTPHRAEIARAAAPARPRALQPIAPARPIVVAERERCWLFCRNQIVLMLGVAY